MTFDNCEQSTDYQISVLNVLLDYNLLDISTASSRLDGDKWVVSFEPITYKDTSIYKMVKDRLYSVMKEYDNVQYFKENKD